MVLGDRADGFNGGVDAWATGAAVPLAVDGAINSRTGDRIGDRTLGETVGERRVALMEVLDCRPIMGGRCANGAARGVGASVDVDAAASLVAGGAKKLGLLAWME